MEPELNCSSQCDSKLCFIHAGVNRQDAVKVLQRLCTLSTTGVELTKRSISPVLCAVVWTLLSCGILLAFCFLLFTFRFKNNRIVKMSSPNLNVLTLFGSVLAYISGFLFAFDEGTQWRGASKAVLLARLWTLCIGSTLVFGPILGKTWRLYRVFTQRVPDKRVIIRDIQLIGLVSVLVLVDLLVLIAWNLTDPIRCSRSVGAVVKVVENNVSYSLSEVDACSSAYSDLWLIIIAVFKGSLLLYGTYLAGLTSNVSHPPVNQSPTIIASVSLVTLSSAVAVPVSVFLQAWPNLVYSTVTGAIFICTLATNCLLFIPQITQWRQFEEEHNNPSQMAKYFSSPSKSPSSAYSQDEIYYLLGENSSMKRLLNEKNAVIDSLQEQVNNAKDKLLRLMSASQSGGEMDSSITNLNSSSTQTTGIQSDCPSTPHPPPDAKPLLSSSPPLTVAIVSPAVPPFPEPPPAPAPTTALRGSTLLPSDGPCADQRVIGSLAAEAQGSRAGDQCSQRPPSNQSAESHRTGPGTAGGVMPVLPSNHARPSPAHAQTTVCHGDPTLHLIPGVMKGAFVSSEQLQEILQELSIDAAMETALRSPGQLRTSRRPSKPKGCDTSLLSPLSLHTPCSPHPPMLFRFPSISPYAMRKRRPPFHSPRGDLSPRYLGPELPPALGKARDIIPRAQDEDKRPSSSCPHTNGIAMVSPSRLEDSDIEEEEEEGKEKTKEGHRLKRRCGTCRRSHGYPAMSCAGRGPGGPLDVEADGAECRQLGRHARDSCGYWDSDSSSSTDYCYYHRPYCDACLRGGAFLSSDSSSDSSDSEYGGYTSLYRSPHPVVFKEDLKPTFV